MEAEVVVTLPAATAVGAGHAVGGVMLKLYVPMHAGAIQLSTTR